MSMHPGVEITFEEAHPLRTYVVEFPSAPDRTIKCHFHALEDGLLAFYVMVLPDQAFTIACFAPGQWKGFSAPPPTKAEVQLMLDWKLQETQRMNALARADSEAKSSRLPKSRIN